MRLRRTLTKILCVTLVLNVTFLIFVVYSRYTRDVNRQIWRQRLPRPQKLQDNNAAGFHGDNFDPSFLAYAPIRRHGGHNKDGENELENVDRNARYQAEYSLWRDWKESLKTQERQRKPTTTIDSEPAQLFNVRKSKHGAHCAEFLQKPIWFVRPPGQEDTPNRDLARGHWQTVYKSNKDFYVYSAYYDVKGTTFWDTGKAIAPVVRIVGVSLRKVLDRPLFCQMWFNDTDKLRIEQAILSGIPEGHDRSYSAVFFLCPLWIPGLAPYAVSLVTAKCGKPYNLLYVQDQPRTHIPPKDFTVCVTPLNRRYNKVNELIQMLEFNQLFGAEYFVFYNFSIGSNVNQVLNKYAAEGLVEILPWDLPLNMDTSPQVNEVQIHYFGQLAALNDCLYRNMYTSKFIVFTDLDELIVPRKHTFWSAMLDSLPETSIYHFRCAFFRRDWPESSDNFTERLTAKRLKLNYLLTLDRESSIQPIYSRSKFILNPRKVETVGIHSIWVTRSGAQREHIVHHSVGLLHHYRILDQAANRTHDPKILDFAGKLVERVVKRWQNLQNLTVREIRVSHNNDL